MTILELFRIKKMFKEPKKKSIIKRLIDSPEDFEIRGYIEDDEIVIKINEKNR